MIQGNALLIVFLILFVVVIIHHFLGTFRHLRIDGT